MTNNVIHTEFIIGNKKTIFLDLKKSKNGTNYLTVTQSLIKENGENERSTLIFFESDLAAFGKAFSIMCVNFNAKNWRKENDRRMEVKKSHAKAYDRWTEAEDLKLEQLFSKGYGVTDLVVEMGRNEGGVRSRLKKIGLIEEVPTEA